MTATAKPITHTCDILVIGGGVAGYCAAIQAGRCGCRTILLEKEAVLGGNAGPNVGVGITGADRYNAYGTETGIIHEIHEEGAWIDARTHITKGCMPYSISRRFEAVVQEKLRQAGVVVLKRHYARQPIVVENRIRKVIAEDLAGFRTAEFNVNGFVIEASGDGEISALAGAAFDVGSESREELGERSAPDERQPMVMGTSLVAIAHRTDAEVRFTPPEDTPDYMPRVWQGRLSAFLNHHNGWFTDRKNLTFLYVTETGGDRDTIRDDGSIYEDLLKQLWAEWNHIKNGPHREAARNWDLLWVSPTAGKRESRRFSGEYKLTQGDLEEGRRFEDDIAYGGHDLDDHKPMRGSANILGISIPPMYGIPLRACCSSSIENVLMAGRLISVTHLAHSSSRVMRTGGAVGQSIGLAAAQCCRLGRTPSELSTGHVGRLQQALLREDATILCRKNEDDEDLAKTATATASSALRFNNQSPDAFVPLITKGGVALWDWPEKLDRIECFLRNTSDREQPMQLEVQRSRRDQKWRSWDEFHDLGWVDLRDEALLSVCKVETTLPIGFEGWFPFNLTDLELASKDPACDGDFLVVSLTGNEMVEWAVAEETSEVAAGVEKGPFSTKWEMWPGREKARMGTLRVFPEITYGEAGNTLNGYHRRYGRGPTNMWMADPQDGFPHELEMKWESGVRFNQIRVTFDNLLPNRHDYPWEHGGRVPDRLVKDYDLEVQVEGEWKEVASVRDNFHRHRVHSFEHVNTTAVRLRVLATHGSGWGARVYEMRVYDKEL